MTECMEILSSKRRPNALEITQHICEEFIEINGDRLYGNDHSIICGIGELNHRSISIIGQLHGHNCKENIHYNFSMTKPEGYRKAIRCIDQAEKFKRPIICFIDTIGAYPGKEAEERGQANAIACCISKLLKVRVPVITIIIGNGCSGGAIALSAANRIAMLENALLSVISPKACAEILWKDSTRVEEAAKLLEMTSWDLLEKGVIDYIIKEPIGADENDPIQISTNIKGYIYRELKRYDKLAADDIVKERYFKFRKIGI